LRAVCGCICSSSSSSSSSSEDEEGREGGLLSFLLLLFVVAVYILTPLISLSGSRVVRGRKQHSLSLVLVLVLSLLFAGVGAAVKKGGREGGVVCTPTGGREGGRGGEVLLLVVCGVSTVFSLMIIYWYPSWAEKRRGGREGGREEGGDAMPLRRPLLPLLSEEEEGGEEEVESGGGAVGSLPALPLRQQQQQQQQQEGQQRQGPSRRLKLLVSFLSLSMLITLSRSILDLLPSSSPPSSSSSSSSPFLFLDLAMFALISPVLWTLYGLDKQLVVFRVLRKGGRAVGRVCGVGREGGRVHSD